VIDLSVNRYDDPIRRQVCECKLSMPKTDRHHEQHSMEIEEIEQDIESLCDARSSSLSSVLILLNLFAVFDTVNHQILLSTLAELAIAGSALSWFTSYLTGRTYQVTWNGSLSRPCTLDPGVPKGSVLGPLLFSLYIRSLGSVITSHGFSYHCYADDTQLFLSFPPSDTHIATRISKCLDDISRWTTANLLKLNLYKTELFIPGKDCSQMVLQYLLPSRTSKSPLTSGRPSRFVS